MPRVKMRLMEYQCFSILILLVLEENKKSQPDRGLSRRLPMNLSWMKNSRDEDIHMKKHFDSNQIECLDN
jgi:hypothetical protein